MVNTLFEYFDSTSAIIFDGKVQFIKPKPLGFDTGGPGGYRRVYTGQRWIKADGVKGKAVQQAYKDAIQRWNDGATDNWARQHAKTEAAKLRADEYRAEYDRQSKIAADADIRYEQMNREQTAANRDLIRVRKEQAELNAQSDAIKGERDQIHAELADKKITIQQSASRFNDLDLRQIDIDQQLTETIELEDSDLKLLEGGEDQLQRVMDEKKAAQSRMAEAQARGEEADRDFETEHTQDELARGDEIEQLPRNRVGDTLDAITRGVGRAASSLGSMIGNRLVREGVTQTAGAIATTALERITGVDVGGVIQQTIPIIGATLAAGGLTTNTGIVVGGLLTIGLGAGAAGYAIGQLNQAQDHIDDQRERQLIEREIWEEENGPLDDHIAAAATQFIADVEQADAEYGDASGLEITDEPDSGEDEDDLPDVDADIENIIGGSGKDESGKKSGESSSSDPGDDSPSGGGGGPPGPVDDDKPASKPIAERKPEDHSLPKWFSLSFLDWLKNLLEGYKMLIIGSYFAGVLVKKFIFSPKRNDRLAA